MRISVMHNKEYFGIFNREFDGMRDARRMRKKKKDSQNKVDLAHSMWI